jgi:predicted O-linked N-acetylglucosamine transferase (SPINDLY family)
VLQKQGRLEAAATAFQQAILLKPDYKRAFGNLRNTYRQLGQLDEAVAHCRRTIERHPANAVAYNSLGTLLLLQDKMEEAKAAFQQAIRRKPDFASAISNLGHTCRNPGQLDKALNYYRQAMALEPSDPTAHSNLIYVIHFHPGYDLAALAEECSQWRRQHADPLKKFIRPHTNLADPERRLKIGYVSSNFYRQAECFFVAPLLEHHDHERFEIHCYSSVNRPDAITAQLQKAADVWHDVLRMSNETLAETIRADGIDILVDLNGFTHGCRPGVFARRPSPVQVSYLGYCSTTGLDLMDYRLSDGFLDPEGTDLSCYSEQTIRLPHSYWCYEPLAPAPSPGPLPELATGIRPSVMPGPRIVSVVVTRFTAVAMVPNPVTITARFQ